MNEPTPKIFKFAALGNAVVDAIVRADDAMLAKYAITKGDSTTLSHPAMLQMAASVTVEEFRSGGSVANSAYTLGKMGSRVCFVGKIGEDPTGRHFAEELVNAGVTVTPAHPGYRTTEVFVMITPDGVRSMAQTMPPAPCPDDTWLDETLLDQSENLLLGAYAASSFPAACDYAAKMIGRQGGKVIISLASLRAVRAAGPLLAEIVAAHRALVIGNQAEWDALCAMTDAHTVRQYLEKTPRVLTRSGAGATYFDGDGLVVDSPTQPIPRPTDMSGAGDAFAAGFLHTFFGGGSPQLALCHGHQLGRAVVLQLGPRLMSMSGLMSEAADAVGAD